jgi:uncharacterized protein DUF998
VDGVPARAAGVCGLLAFLTFNVGWIVGTIAQPDAFSSADDAISDLGAMTADAAWVYNQIGANLTGLLVVALALGLWRALSPNVLGRVGAVAVAVMGIAVFAGGVFRLDCQGIDSGCENDSWHASAHKVASGFAAGATFIAPLVLAFTFRRIPPWRDSWLPTLAVIPALFVANVLFSFLGDGAAVRAGTVVILLWVAFLGVRLLQKGERRGESEAPPPAPT